MADMSYFAPGFPAVYTGLRGICYAEITVRTLKGDLHSGSYGEHLPLIVRGGPRTIRGRCLSYSKDSKLQWGTARPR